MDWRDILLVIWWQDEYGIKRFNIKDAAYNSGLWVSTDDGDIRWNVEHQATSSFGGKLDVLSSDAFSLKWLWDFQV